jgi:hypothetical protein
MPSHFLSFVRSQLNIELSLPSSVCTKQFSIPAFSYRQQTHAEVLTDVKAVANMPALNSYSWTFDEIWNAELSAGESYRPVLRLRQLDHQVIRRRPIFVNKWRLSPREQHRLPVRLTRTKRQDVAGLGIE